MLYVMHLHADATSTIGRNKGPELGRPSVRVAAVVITENRRHVGHETMTNASNLKFFYLYQHC